MNNKEVELKFVITKNKRQEIIEDVSKSSRFISEKRQIDTYYIPSFKEFEIGGETMECLRIRETANRSILCYKKIHREATPVFCDEYELEISDKKEMEKILFALGFSVQMVIDKTRSSFECGEFEIDFDSVNGELELMEVELKNDSLDTSSILDFVKRYGLTKDDVTYRGIQKLVQELSKKE